MDGGISSAMAGAAVDDFREDTKFGLDTFLSMRENRLARNYNTKMANSVYQRTMKDMQLAGLNPILAGKFGGNTTPPAVGAQLPQGKDSSALEAAMAASSLQVQEAQARSLNATAAKQEVESRVSQRTELAQINMVLETLYKLRGEGDASNAQWSKINAEIKKLEAEKELIDTQRQHSSFGLSEAEATSKFYKSAGGTFAPWLDRVIKYIPLPTKAGRR